MAGNTSDSNENVRSIINLIDDDSDGSLPLLNNQSDVMERDDEDFKTSESVTEAAETAIGEGNWTVERILRAAGNTASSNLNLAHHNTDTISSGCSRIVEVDSITTGRSVQPYIAPSTNPPESQITVPTTTNSQQQPETRKHIMISYNRATATTVCQRIYDRLTLKGYVVWFDRTNLTDGSIIDAMGEAIDNAYVVLLCINKGYSTSRYCLKEAKYAEESKVPLIPCMMEENYRPRGGLGVIKSDLKHIEFFDDNKFEESFKELTQQIDTIQARLVMRPAVVDNTDFRTRFNSILAEHVQSIRNFCLPRGRFDEAELRTVLRRLIQAFSPETWQSFQNDPSNDVDDRQIPVEDNDRLLQHLIRIQQENCTRIEQHLVEQDEHLAAFHRFQQRQGHQHVQQNSRDHLGLLLHIEEVHREGQERSDRIERQLQQLTELVINQQEQHTREREIMLQPANQSSEASTTVQQQQTSHFDSGLLKSAITATVLLCTLLVLFKSR